MREITKTKKKNKNEFNISFFFFRTSLFIIMSFIYAKLLVVVCIAYVISEAVTYRLPLYYYEGFFTYLYGVSILFLLYVFCFLLQESACCSRGADTPPPQPKPQKQPKESKDKSKKKDKKDKKDKDKNKEEKNKKEFQVGHDFKRKLNYCHRHHYHHTLSVYILIKL